MVICPVMPTDTDPITKIEVAHTMGHGHQKVIIMLNCHSVV